MTTQENRALAALDEFTEAAKKAKRDALEHWISVAEKYGDQYAVKKMREQLNDMNGEEK